MLQTQQETKKLTGVAFNTEYNDNAEMYPGNDDKDEVARRETPERAR